VLQKANFWERHRGASFNDRQRLMLNRLLNGFEGKLTSSKWAIIAKGVPDDHLSDHTLPSMGQSHEPRVGGRNHVRSRIAG
jgi:hypothetical protein